MDLTQVAESTGLVDGDTHLLLQGGCATREQRFTCSGGWRQECRPKQGSRSQRAVRLVHWYIVRRPGIRSRKSTGEDARGQKARQVQRSTRESHVYVSMPYSLCHCGCRGEAESESIQSTCQRLRCAHAMPVHVRAQGGRPLSMVPLTSSSRLGKSMEGRDRLS